MGWLIALGIIVLLAILPLGARILYNEEGFFIWLHVGPVKFLWFPDNKDEKSEEKKEKTKKTIYMAAGKQHKVHTEKKVGGLLTDFIDIIKAYLLLLRLLRPKVLRIGGKLRQGMGRCGQSDSVAGVCACNQKAGHSGWLRF